MRLLKRLSNGNFDLVSFNDDHAPPYAILSHTWVEGQEITYNELVGGIKDKDKAGYHKIRFCVERAANDGLQYSWVDTGCIDKSSSNELSAAINSMFRWYKRAEKCYIYLSDVQILGDWKQAFRRSRWFTRGWTLQELLAPSTIDFFSKEGKWLGDKTSLEQEIYEITKIPIEALRGQELTEFSVEERMSWMAKRTTTLKEDRIYCLLGIFGVFLSLIYGEGEVYANLRLEEEIKKRQEAGGTASLHDLIGNRSPPSKPGVTDDNADIKKIIKEALRSSSVRNWLMIIGNVDDSAILFGDDTGDPKPWPASLHDYLPCNNGCKILFTTLNRKIVGSLSQSNVLELHELNETEAWKLLERRMLNPAFINDKKAVGKLLDSRAHLPLAIVQAAAFIINTSVSVSEYLLLFQDAGTKMEIFAEHVERHSVYERIENTIVKHVQTLKNYALIAECRQIQPSQKERLFDVQQMTHLLSSWRLKKRSSWNIHMARTALRLEGKIPYGGQEKKDKWITYIPHASYMNSSESTLNDSNKLSFLARIEQCQKTLGQLTAAESTHQEVLIMGRKLLEQGNMGTTGSVSKNGPPRTLEEPSPPPSTVAGLYNDCSSSDRTYTTKFNYQYQFTCDVDIGADDLLGNSGFHISHSAGNVAYAWQDCVESCGSFNQHNGGRYGVEYTNQSFRGAVFKQNMAAITADWGVNCFLMNDTLQSGLNPTRADGVVSAQISG
ncbi:hypothetical protein N0V90_012785 [Kalmusia sp. IMI 367209]|nr:hypothetical protein N0V90_012785 [Kalmusia sp. IMI 367209]